VGVRDRPPQSSACIAYDLIKQFGDLRFGCFERLSPKRSSRIEFTQRLAFALLGGTQIALLFESVENRIERSWANSISMPREFVAHSETKDGMLSGMVQHMEPD